MEETLYIIILGREQGPFPWKKLRELVKTGKLSRIHDVSLDGQTWVKATEYPELFAPEPTHDEPTTPQPTTTQPGQEASQPRQAEEPIATVETGGFTVVADDTTDNGWYYDQNGSPAGPYSFSTLKTMISDGQLSANCSVWKEGMSNWKLVSSIPSLSGSRQPAGSDQEHFHPVAQDRQDWKNTMQEAEHSNTSDTDQSNSMSFGRNQLSSLVTFLMVTGYLCSLLSLLLLPIALGLAALACGIGNLVQGGITHGVLQIVLSLTCCAFGTYLGPNIALF